jgi:N-glycosidase YbiA
MLYPTSEHAYQANKFTDIDLKKQIQQTKSPLLAKQLSHKNDAFKRNDWNEKTKLEVMESILISKLEQHSEVKQVLLKTENRLIAEDSPVDDFWGYTAGTGQNHLGKIWMKLRENLQKS